jgi:hypothetical protein
MPTDFSSLVGVVKTLRARRDIRLTGGRTVKGPVRQLAHRRLSGGKWEQEFLPLNTKMNPHDSYDVIETEAGQEFEVDQVVAKELVFRGDADIIAGGMVTILQMRDGAHCYLPWTVGGNAWGRPSDSPFELCESLTDCVGWISWPHKVGTQLRIVLENHSGQFCFLGESSNGKLFRVLRLRDKALASEASKAAERNRFIDEMIAKQKKVAQELVV